MISNEKLNEMKELVKVLNKYAEEYYVYDTPSVSDAIYDQKYDKLVSLEKETGVIIPGSPTQRVGGRILEGFKKVTHKTRLWSLDKAQTFEELKSFYDNVMKAWNDYKQINPTAPKPKFVVMKKLDGLTLNVKFDEEGNINNSATRGTGEVGENVTEQSKTITNLPHFIEYKKPIAVHGEVIMTKKAFEEYNKNSDIPLKNLRNGASGAIRNLNLDECAKRKLSVMFYNITETVEPFNNLSDMLNFIKQIGLPTVEYSICDKYDDIVTRINEINEERSSLQYDIDGVVIKVDDIGLSEFMGYTVKYPKYAIAFKFEAEEATTILTDVEWSVGRTGRINPTGIVEPIELAGATVRRATLNNMDDIIKKGVRIGSEVIIRRSNDVIPEILGVIEEGTNENTEEIKAPTVCPACGSELIRDGAFYFCENTLGCKPQLTKSIVHFCQREAMNIEGFSDKTSEQFVDNGIIETVADLYNLEEKKEQIISLEKFGERKYQKLIQSVANSRKCLLHQLLFGLGISNVGLKTAKDISKHFKTLENIKKATVEELLQVSEVGQIIAECVYQWFNSEKNIDLLSALIEHLEIEEVKESVTTENPFLGKNVVVTGTLKNFTRTSIKSKLEELGAKSAGSVSKKTDYVLYGDEAGSKLTKAIDLGVKTITEEEFLDMLK